MSPPEKLSIFRRLRRSHQRGEPFVWLSGGALALALLMISGLLFVVVTNGLGYFWPARVATATLADGSRLLGVISDRQAELRGAGGEVIRPAQIQFKTGNREITGADFRWVNADNVTTIAHDPDVVMLEREENGDFIGFLVDVRHGDTVVATGDDAAWTALQERHEPALRLAEEASHLQRHDIGELSAEQEELRLELRRLDRQPATEDNTRERTAIKGRVDRLEQQYEELRSRANELMARARLDTATFRTIDGDEKSIPLSQIVRAFRPNTMSWGERAAHYVSRVHEFITGEPRESNTEGGVFPAIFGTVAMTLIMTLVVTPFGVITAFYLREYAAQGPVVRLVRIAINNLAGVPSIVFGVFGLGFFIYFVGGGIDRLFFAEELASGRPTFGTGGILWASLTLALLTVPVVIVATEESIAAVPRGMREGSLALGASKFQTICRVVLPASVPGILTGVILAMARGAGEVAPLMITGVVKLAPELPLDTSFPFVHLDRKFMHLGFHIFDVGFQSPNIEAAKPMVFTTTLLLITIVVLLNLAAIRLRDRIRRRFRSGAFA